MNKSKIFRLMLLFLVTIIIAGCKDKASKISHSSFHPRISAFTSGLIPTTGNIMVEFADSIPGSVPGSEVISSLVNISPKLHGTWSWIDHRTMRFIPTNSLLPDQKWEVTIHLKKIFKDEPEKFFFIFGTLPQNYRVNTDPLKPFSETDFANYKISGKVLLADDTDKKNVEEMIIARLNGKKVQITWNHSDGKSHLFEIGPLARTEKSGTLEITHTGEPVNVKEKGEIAIVIPAINDFSVQSVQVVQHPRQLVRITFSDPLRPDQDLEGLIILKGAEKAPYLINQNILEIYPASPVYGNRELIILPGIYNAKGNTIEETHQHNIYFASVKPAVEFIGQGNIIPFSDGLILHFKAVSLKGIIVRVIKIYENNVPYFLQVNTIDGDSQLKRAGRLVYRSVISLEKDATLEINQWNNFTLELSKLIKPDPGAIYRIELGFDQSMSAYPCAQDSFDDSKTSSLAIKSPDEDFWDNPDDYYSSYPYYYDEDWNWRDRDNPCASSYYTRSRWVSRNLLASNLGIIAKGGTAGTYHAYVTNLLNTEPVPEVTLEILNFQMQSLGTAKTTSEGKAVFETKEKPFLLIARKENHRGYLRMDDGRMLPLSRFDVSGQTITKGLKGYIYGERGVWRPGDSLFISFIPEDKYQLLPPNHPVTMELINPRGQLIYRQVARHPQNRIYSFSTATTEDALTGFWLARVIVGDALFEKTIRIETVKPNRLRINLDFGGKILYGYKPVSANLFSEWLHGSVASKLKTQVAITMQPIKTSFKNYFDFNFDNESIEFEPSEETVFDGNLNEQGKAAFSFQPKLMQKAPGMLKATFTTRVFEEGGSFSIDKLDMPLSPYDRYVGVRTPKGDANGLLQTDITHNIELITVNSLGEPVSVSGLDYRIYKINWRWWWEKSEENLGRYLSSQSSKIILSGSTKTSNGKGSVPLRINKPEWGRYLIVISDPQGGHSTSATVLIDWPGWAQRTGGTEADAATMLVFTSDKESYNVGETATIQFPSSAGGRALISIENGTSVLESRWVKASNVATSFSFKITEKMTPNIFVHITLLQPHNQTANDLPIRLYGIIPLMVQSPAGMLTPEINTAGEWKPEETATINVSEKGGQPMNYTLAIVDEGLLDLTRFRTPDPWGHFNAREALGVKTWDIYDQILGAYGGRIERMFGIGGGDDIIGAKSENKTRRFEPMVRFLGPFELKKGGNNKHSIKVPDYTGSVRVMAVATNGKATGSAGATVPVKKSLMVWGNLPRVLGPGETVMLPVTIYASDKIKGDVKIKVNLSKNLTLRGSNIQTVNFKNEGEQTIFFEMQANNNIGTSKIEIFANSTMDNASQVIYLPVRNPNPVVTNVVTAIIQPNGKTNLNYQLPGIGGSNKSTIEISAIPPMNFGQRLNYLLDYPHGCIEQVTSGAFPQIYLPELVQLDPVSISTAQSNVQSAIGKLNSYQTSNGGFAYWPGGQTPDDWATSYAGHFMIEAEKKGYAVPAQIKKNWLNYQKTASLGWLPNRTGNEIGSDFIQSYRLFTLALAGESDISGMNRLRQQPKLSAEARWRLSATYALTGMGEMAKELTQTVTEESPAKIHYNTYGSPERNMAMVLETYILLGQKENAARLAIEIAKKLNSSEWMSTHTTAYCLLALSKYSAGKKVTSGGLNLRFQVNNNQPVNTSFSVPLMQKDVNLEDKPKGTVLIENKSASQVFANLILKGQPLRDTSKEAFAAGLVIRLEYFDINNKPLDVSNVQQGTDFKAIVIISNPGANVIKNLALTQIFPGGWEIRNTRFDESGSVHELDQPDYKDIRDDRVYSYFNLNAGETKRLVTILHSSYSGNFFLPPVICEAMYDYSIRSKVPGRWVKVVK